MIHSIRSSSSTLIDSGVTVFESGVRNDENAKDQTSSAWAYLCSQFDTKIKKSSKSDLADVSK